MEDPQQLSLPIHSLRETGHLQSAMHWGIGDGTLGPDLLGGVVSKGYIITADGCYRRGVIVFSEGANGEFSMLSCAHHLS